LIYLRITILRYQTDINGMAGSGPQIVFMGTPDFAVESLKQILQAGYTVKGVITPPDKPSGRGLQLSMSPVKEFALKHNLQVLQPLKLRDPEFLKTLKELHADLQVVVAFRMLPEEVWSMPSMGTFNLHASLLPQYRGAAPVNWAVINGETKTGVTTFFINHEIDKGSIIFREETYIGQADTAGDLHDRLMVLGASLVIKTITTIATGKVKLLDQQEMLNGNILRSAPKIFKHDCKINWKTETGQIYNFIRGLSPYPAAWSELINNKGELMTVKIFFGTVEMTMHQLEPGTINTDGKTYLKVATNDGYINIKSIQLQGKKRMNTAEFLRGFPLSPISHFQ
jgi:methionyl-tRNA formyltransferase